MGELKRRAARKRGREKGTEMEDRKRNRRDVGKERKIRKIMTRQK